MNYLVFLVIWILSILFICRRTELHIMCNFCIFLLIISPLLQSTLQIVPGLLILFRSRNKLLRRNAVDLSESNTPSSLGIAIILFIDKRTHSIVITHEHALADSCNICCIEFRSCFGTALECNFLITVDIWTRVGFVIEFLLGINVFVVFKREFAALN